jgi:hypothetical protein
MSFIPFFMICFSDFQGQGGGAVHDSSRFTSPHFSHGQEQVTFGSFVFVDIVQGKILPCLMYVKLYTDLWIFNSLLFSCIYYTF